LKLNTVAIDSFIYLNSQYTVIFLSLSRSLQQFKLLLNRQPRHQSNQPCSEPTDDKTFDVQTRWHQLDSRRYFNALLAFAGGSSALDVSGSGSSFVGSSSSSQLQSPMQLLSLPNAGDAVNCSSKYLTEQLNSMSSTIHLDIVRLLFAILDVVIVYRRWILFLAKSDSAGSRSERHHDTENDVIRAAASTPGDDESYVDGDRGATCLQNGIKKDVGHHKQNGFGRRPNGTDSSGGTAWNRHADETIGAGGNGNGTPPLSRNRWPFSSECRTKCFQKQDRCHSKKDVTTGSKTVRRTNIYGRLLQRLYLCLTVFVELYVIVQAVDYCLNCFVRQCCHPAVDSAIENLIRLETNAEQASSLHVSDSLPYFFSFFVGLQPIQNLTYCRDIDLLCTCSMRHVVPFWRNHSSVLVPLPDAMQQKKKNNGHADQLLRHIAMLQF
jgi:hypothetical protein